MRESYQNALAAGIEKRFQNLEYEVMADIVRRIQKAGKITSTADWELQRMQILGKSTADLRKIVASAVQFDDDEVERLYREVVDNEYTVYKDQYLKINRKFVPYEENKELQQITKALTQQSNEDLNNITKSMGFMVRNATGKLEFTPLGEKYNEYLDQAITDMTSGVYDYNTLVRRLVKQMTNSGLRTERPFAENSEDKSGIDYPSGWHNRIDVAARRALLTGFSQLTGQIMDMNAEALHVDRFEVSWHMGARPEHAAWQGKVYTKQQLIDICGLGTGPGLLGWNCRHEYYLFFPGSQRTYTDEWLAKQNAKEAETTTFRGREYNTYQATQKQRQLETRMRAQRETVKLMEAAEADPDDITIEKCKYQAQMDEYRDFSRTMGLKTQMERVYGDLKGKVAPNRSVYEKWKNGEIQREILTEKERRALNQYLSAESYMLNEKLRNGEELTPEEEEMKRALSRALKKMPRYKGTVTRSLYFYDEETLKRALSEYQIGDEFRTPQFMSTTAGAELYNPSGQLQLIIENTKLGADIRKYNPGEAEVLYNIGNRFNVLDVVQKSDTWYVFMKEKE